jgi:hypothetical protein
MHAIERIRLLQRDIARLQARQLAEIAAYEMDRDGARDVAAELALVLSVTEHTAQKTLALARALTDRLPNTFAAMKHGELDPYKASKIADPTACLTDEHALAVDNLLAGRLAGKNPGQLRRAAIASVHRVDPEGAAHRAHRRRAERRVESCTARTPWPRSPPTSPVEIATAAYTRLDRTARALRRADEPRTLDQLRADVLAELLLGTHGTVIATPYRGSATARGSGTSTTAESSTTAGGGTTTTTPEPAHTAPAAFVGPTARPDRHGAARGQRRYLRLHRPTYLDGPARQPRRTRRARPHPRLHRPPDRPRPGQHLAPRHHRSHYRRTGRCRPPPLPTSRCHCGLRAGTRPPLPVSRLPPPHSSRRPGPRHSLG